MRVLGTFIPLRECLGGLCLALALHSLPLTAAQILSLSEVLSLAESYSPALASAQAQREAAVGALRTARAYPNPMLDLAMGHSSPRQIGSTSGANALAILAQPLELPSVRQSRARRGEARLEAAEHSSHNISLLVRAQVQQAFYEILRRQTEAAIAAENQRLLEDIRDRVKVRVSTGEAPRYELVKAEAEALSAIKNYESATLQVDQAKLMLRALVGSALPEDFEVRGELPPPIAPPPLEKLRGEVLARYPALAQAKAEMRSARAGLQLEQRLRYPQPTLLAGFERDPDLDQWRLGLAIPLPLWNQRQGPIAEALAEVQLSEANAEQQRLLLLRELESAYTRYRIATRQIEAFEAGLLKEAESALRVAESAYRLGARGILDYLDAQRSYQRVRNDYINARFDRQAALIEIERLRAPEMEG